LKKCNNFRIIVGTDICLTHLGNDSF